MRGENAPKPARRFAAGAGRRAGVGAQRAAQRPADRHYLAVVAAEARRLGRQLRPPVTPAQMRPEGSH